MHVDMVVSSQIHIFVKIYWPIVQPTPLLDEHVPQNIDIFWLTPTLHGTGELKSGQETWSNMPLLSKDTKNTLEYGITLSASE